MATHSINQSQTLTAPGLRRHHSLFVYATYCETIKLLRTPGFVIPSLVFPSLLFLMFGLPNLNNHVQGVGAGAYIMTSFGGYITMLIGLMAFSTGLASERAQGWARLLRATPLSSLVYFGSKCIPGLFMGFLSLLLLFLVATIAGHVILPPGTWALLILVLLVGTIPFILLGFIIGSLASASAAPAIANIIYMPLSFASGLLVPLPSLPGFVQVLAPYLPGYQIGQLGHALIGANGIGSIWQDVAWLAGYTLLFAIFALYAYRIDQVRNYA